MQQDITEYTDKVWKGFDTSFMIGDDEEPRKKFKRHKDAQCMIEVGYENAVNAGELGFMLMNYMYYLWLQGELEEGVR